MAGSDDARQTVVTMKTVTTTRTTSRGDDGSQTKVQLRGFWPLVIVAQVFGLLALIFTLCWTRGYSTFGNPGEFGFSKINVFNWHPILTCFAFIYLTGNGLLVFRILRNLSRNTVKLIHAGIKGLNILLGFLGLLAAYAFHENFSYRHLYTLHSWVGLLTAIVFFAQAIVGTLAFLYPGLRVQTRSMLMPYHRFVGQVLLVLAVTTAVSGINQRAQIVLGNTYADKGSQAILMNLSGILYVLFAAVVIYLVSSVHYKRQSLQEDIQTAASRTK